MTGTTRLALPYVVASQTAKEVTHNADLDALDARIDGTLSVDLSAGNGSATLAQIQGAMLIVAAGAAVARNLTLAAFIGYRWIYNTGSASGAVAVKVGSTSITLAVGSLGLFQGDGTTNGLVQIPLPAGSGAALIAAYNAFTISQGGPIGDLTDAANIAWDMDLVQIARVTLGGNRSLSLPSNRRARTYALIAKQDGTGSRTLSYNAVFKFAGGTPFVLSTAAGAKDVLTMIDDGTDILVVGIQAFS